MCEVGVAKQNEDGFNAGYDSTFHSVFVIDIQVNVVVNIKVMWCIKWGVRGEEYPFIDTVVLCWGKLIWFAQGVAP